MTSFPKTVYRTPTPEYQISETYEITIESFPNPAEPSRCWIVRELHGWYDEATRTFHHKVETLHPTDPKHFMTLEEAQRDADKQVLRRANEGFHFLFTIDYFNPPWYSRFEVVLPSGQIKPLP